MLITISRPDDDGVIWFKKAENNEFVGYVTENGDTYAMQNGWAEKVGTAIDKAEAESLVRIYYTPKAVMPIPEPPPVERNPSKEIALIGFLTAKLATYEPDCDVVKQGLEYLKNVRS